MSSLMTADEARALLAETCECDALHAELATAQDSYAVLRTILTLGYTDATGDPEVAPDAPLIDLARAVCDSLQPLHDARDAALAERDRAVSSASWWEALGRDIGAKADALLVERAAVEGALAGTTVPPPGDSLARRVYETAQLAADFRRDLEGLRAIVEGRTTPPTPEEVAAHGGWWLVLMDDGKGPSMPWTTRSPLCTRSCTICFRRFIPLDNDIRPTTWPTVPA